jgi:hypothetical protein
LSLGGGTPHSLFLKKSGPRVQRASSTTRRRATKHCFFSRVGAPGAKFYVRDPALPLAICLETLSDSKELVDVSRTGCETLFFLEWEAPEQNGRTSSTSRGRATKHCFFSTGRPRSKILDQGAGRPTRYLWRKTLSYSKEPRRRLADGPLNTVFCQVGGPGAKFYIRDQALPLAIC